MSIANLIPPPPHSGEPISPEWGRAVIRALHALVPQGGANISIGTSPNGYTITTRPSLAPPKRTAPAPAAKLGYLHPVKCKTRDGVDGWSVTIGSVNNDTIAMESGKLVGHADAGMYSSDYTFWAEPFTTPGIICLNAACDANDGYLGGILGSIIKLIPESSPNAGLPPDTLTQSYRGIGYIRQDDDGNWTVIARNSSNFDVRVVGGAWDWWTT